MKDLLTSCYLLASEYYLLSPRLWRRTRERPRGKWVMTIAKEINSIIFLCSTHAGLCVPAFSLVFTNRGLRIGSPPKRAGLVIFLSRGEGAWVTQGILPRKTKIPKCIVGSMSQSKKNMADQISLWVSDLPDQNSSSGELLTLESCRTLIWIVFKTLRNSDHLM